MSVFQTINNVAADAHGFRVTLNIISQSTNCPPDLKAVVETLRDDHNWNRHKLSKVEMESIYAHLDSEVCGHALGEWNVESHRMRDWGFPFWRSDHTEWWDGEHRAVDCQLCGHRDNRYEFPLVNLKTGEEIWTGSTCIVKYGVTVDGDACAETALKKLNSMKKKSKTAQTKDAWEKAYPDADVVIERLCRARHIVERQYVPYGVRRAADADGTPIWRYPESQRKHLRTFIRAVVKYHAKNGYLSPQRTEALWGTDGKADGPTLLLAERMADCYESAAENDPREQARRYWKQFADDHPNMNSYQSRQVAYWMSRGIPRAQLYERQASLLTEIEDQHDADGKPAEPTKPSGLTKVSFL